MNAPLNVKSLNWNYGETKVLKNIDLNIKEGKFTSIVGPNGSGKTTLLKNMIKIVDTNSKSVFVYGEDIHKMKHKDIATKIASVPQSTEMEYNFSVTDVVLMGRAPHKTRFQSESKEDFERAYSAMKQTETYHLRERKINNLSGGERQRVIIARAIAQDTDIMVLDEPISHLDIHHQIEVMKIAKELSKKGMTVITILHDLNFAMQYSDNVILINDGKVVCEGNPEKVLTKENIKKVYNVEIMIMENPITKKPHIIPITI